MAPVDERGRFSGGTRLGGEGKVTAPSSGRVEVGAKASWTARREADVVEKKAKPYSGGIGAQKATDRLDHSMTVSR